MIAKGTKGRGACACGALAISLTVASGPLAGASPLLDCALTAPARCAVRAGGPRRATARVAARAARACRAVWCRRSRRRGRIDGGRAPPCVALQRSLRDRLR